MKAMTAMKFTLQHPQYSFERELEMYVIQEGSTYVFSFPSESYSLKIEKDSDWDHFIERENVFGHRDFREKFATRIRELLKG